MTDAVELSDAAAGYGRAKVFEAVSLRVASGSCLAVAGPNGAGKSTLLKAIAGVVPLWSGNLRIEGRSVNDLGPEDRVRAGVALCPEGRRIFSTLTVEQNLVLGATTVLSTFGRRAARREIGERLARACEMFPVLVERLHGAGGALSGGQQQMLAIARALMSNPRILLLDEPSLGLAPRIVEDLYERLDTLRSGGLALILVEESATRATSLADDALILRNGKIVVSGRAREVAASPRLKEAYLGTAST